MRRPGAHSCCCGPLVSYARRAPSAKVSAKPESRERELWSQTTTLATLSAGVVVRLLIQGRLRVTDIDLRCHIHRQAAVMQII
jgi:hypothetical protein